jgi:hypothetical protein
MDYPTGSFTDREAAVTAMRCAMSQVSGRLYQNRVQQRAAHVRFVTCLTLLTFASASSPANPFDFDWEGAVVRLATKAYKSSRTASKKAIAKAAKPVGPSQPGWQPNESPYGVVLDVQSLSLQQIPQAVQAAHQLGFRMIRTVVPWYEVEPQPKSYRFQKYDTLVGSAKSCGVDLVFTLSYCPPWASSLPKEPVEISSRAMPEGLEAWRRFIGTTVSRYKEKVRFWQIWERLDMSNFRGTRQDYAALLVAASQAAKLADPFAQVLASEPGGMDLGFIAYLCQKPTLASFDAICLNPRVETPELAARYFSVLKAILQKSGSGPAKKIYVTDWSFPISQDATGSPLHFDPVELPSFVVKAYAVAFSMGAERVFWTELRDSETNSPRGASWGLVDGEFQPRPAARALKAFFDFAPQRLSAELWAMGDTPLRVVSLGGEGAASRALVWSATGELRLSPTELPGIKFSPRARMWSLQQQAEAEANLLQRGEPVAFGNTPVFLSDVELASTQLSKVNAWFPASLPRDYVYLDLSETATKEGGGIASSKYRSWRAANPEVVSVEGQVAVKLVPNGEAGNPFLYCDVDDDFLFYNLTGSPVTVEVTAYAADTPSSAGFNLMYDSPRGHVFSSWQPVQPGTGWQQYDLTLTDALFANKLGFDFRISCLGSKQPVSVARVVVRRSKAD